MHKVTAFHRWGYRSYFKTPKFGLLVSSFRPFGTETPKFGFVNSGRPVGPETENIGQSTLWVRPKAIVAYSSTPPICSHPCNSYEDLTVSSNWRIPNSQLHSSAIVQAVKMAGGSSGDTETVSYKLSDSCTLFIHEGDITKWFINGENDAIVNAANELMLGGGGVDGAIHRAAGPELLEACHNVPEVQPGVRCPAGSARITEAFNLPVSRIIHTVGPIYDDEGDSASVLSSAYKSSLEVAAENQIKYVAFPAISCGVYGYPFEDAAEVALSTLQNYVGDLEEVHFVLFNLAVWKPWLEKADELLEKKN